MARVGDMVATLNVETKTKFLRKKHRSRQFRIAALGYLFLVIYGWLMSVGWHSFLFSPTDLVAFAAAYLPFTLIFMAWDDA